MVPFGSSEGDGMFTGYPQQQHTVMLLTLQLAGAVVLVNRARARRGRHTRALLWLPTGALFTAELYQVNTRDAKPITTTSAR